MHNEVTYVLEKYVSARLCFCPFQKQMLGMYQISQGCQRQIFILTEKFQGYHALLINILTGIHSTKKGMNFGKIGLLLLQIGQDIGVPILPYNFDLFEHGSYHAMRTLRGFDYLQCNSASQEHCLP